MSIHDLARTASDDLRSHTAADVDAGLDALLAVDTRRRRRTRVAGTLVAAATVAAAWWGIAALDSRTTGPQPTPAPSSLQPDQSVCERALVTCLGDRTYRFDLTAPVVWQIPRGFGVASGTGASTNLVESYGLHGAPDGVTVIEGVSPASRRSRAAAPHAPAGAKGFIRWLAARPYLHASAVRRTTLAGGAAWQVRVHLRADAGDGPGRCTGAIDGLPCHQITFQDGGITGIWSDMVADYTAYDSSTAGTVVVWSWAFGHGARGLDDHRALVDGLTLSP